MMAAWYAAAGGCSVVLFEKQKKAGRKILITGNGRCNITNRHLDPARYHGRNPMFVNNVFARFGLSETIDYFSSIGLPLVEENNGRMYPASMQASTVVKLLEYELERKGVDFRLHRRIDSIVPRGSGFELTTAGRESHRFGSVILCAGSCAWSGAGASRSGYDLARSLGHRVHDPFPAILPLTIPMKSLHRLQGIKWDCALKVLNEGRRIATSSGELLFTGYGISGPAALDISRAVNESVIRGERPEIIIDFFPGFSEEELLTYLETVLADGARETAFSLGSILKERMPEVLLEAGGVDPVKRAGELSRSDRKAIVTVLKGLHIEPGEPRGFNDAVVAAGGVDVSEIDPATMESRIVKNLYITGELLDIDGDSGGYNLQFAWSTGALAGMAQSG